MESRGRDDRYSAHSTFLAHYWFTRRMHTCSTPKASQILKSNNYKQTRGIPLKIELGRGENEAPVPGHRRFQFQGNGMMERRVGTPGHVSVGRPYLKT